ncbi:MAG: hypothetical protein ACFNM6_05100 [Prevotella sp.]
MNINRYRFRMSSRARRAVAILCLWAGVTATTMADDTQITIWKKQGGSISYALSAKPRITYGTSELLLSTGGISVTYPVADVERITFEPVASSIGQTIQHGPDRCLITVTAESVNIEGAAPHEPVNLYTTDGLLLHTYRTDSRGTLAVKLASINAYGHQGPQIYIIKAGPSTLKITRP